LHRDPEIAGGFFQSSQKQVAKGVAVKSSTGITVIEQRPERFGSTR